MTIDITPPSLEIIADDRYVNFGGVGLIVYKPSPDTATTGIKIGNYFFPGYKGQIKSQPEHYIAFFAHAYNVPADERATLVATDKAGNTREARLAYTLKNVKYKKSTLKISEDFLRNKVTPLVNDVGARQGAPKDIFIKVNKALRKENEDKIKGSPKRRCRFYGKAPSVSSATPRSRPTSPTRAPTFTTKKKSIKPTI
jgi:hypothetical protein